MSDDSAVYREQFLSESAEYLQAMTEGLLALEADPHDLEPVETVFRGAHSLKGMAASMGYEHTQELTHKMESLMATVRQRQQPPDAELVDLMLRATDACRELIAAEASGGAVPDATEVERALEERTRAAAASGQVTEPAGRLVRVDVTLDEDCVLKGVRAYMVIKRLGRLGTVVGTEPDARDLEDERFERSFAAFVRTHAELEAVRAAVASIAEVADVSVRETPAEHAVDEDAEARREAIIARAHRMPKLSDAQTVRISVGHLDTLVNLVGELVIVRSRLDGVARRLEDPELIDALDVLAQTSRDLQHEVMRTRMVPVGNVFQRFPRMVRDLARDLGKEAALELEGLDIELDRTVLDEIGDPIVHLLRNCVDHGIEPPEEREALGKPRRGAIRLVAEREREHVRLTVTDDGRGMDVDRIWEKAVAAGIVDPDARDAYSASDVLLLSCTPGLSTAERATKVSGRGVGMDVVKARIERLGGTLRIDSVRGEGTRVTLTLPLTLAIIQALLVACGDQVFALPLSAVDEVYDQRSARVHTVDGHPVAVLPSSEVVPLLTLAALCGTGAASALPEPGDQVVVMRQGDEARALAVTRLVGRQEIVIKPLSRLLSDVEGFGGATVLGDGRVVLILDPRALFAQEAGNGS